jgi:hypothetical protein
MALVRLAQRRAPGQAVAWPDRRRAPHGEHDAALAWREGTRRWKQGGTVHDQFIPF